MKHIAFALACFTLIPAQAEIVTIEYTGIVNTVREITGGDWDDSRQVVSSNVIPGTIAIGDTFHGKFSYDTKLQMIATNGDVAVYRNLGASPSTVASLTIDKSGASMSGFDATEISVWNLPGDDLLSFRPAFSYSPYAYFVFAFADPTGEVLDDVSIPGEVNVNDFWQSSIEIGWSSAAVGQTVQIEAMVTSFDKVSAVPEPSTWALLLAGLGVAGAAARRRQHSSLPA